MLANSNFACGCNPLQFDNHRNTYLNEQIQKTNHTIFRQIYTTYNNWHQDYSFNSMYVFCDVYPVRFPVRLRKLKAEIPFYENM